MTNLPEDSKARKAIPLVRGFLDYFPAAAAAVAEVSRAGNEKHNPGEEMHHARGKSMDHADCIVRHLMDRGTIDPEDGLRHTAKVAWRAMALLQEELEREAGAPLARGAKVPDGTISTGPECKHPGYCPTNFLCICPCHKCAKMWEFRHPIPPEFECYPGCPKCRGG